MKKSDALRKKLLIALAGELGEEKEKVKEALLHVAYNSDLFDDYLLAADFCEMYGYQVEERLIWMAALQQGFAEEGIIHYRLGYIFYHQGDYESAIEHFAHATSLPPMGSLLYVKALWELGRFKQAEGLLREALGNPEFEREYPRYRADLPPVLVRRIERLK